MDEQKRQFENTVLLVEKLQSPGKRNHMARVTEICDASDTDGVQDVTNYRQTDIRRNAHQIPSREISRTRQNNFKNFNEQSTIVKRSAGDLVQRYAPISGDSVGLLWELLMALLAFDPRLLLALHAFGYALLPRIPSVPTVNLSFNDSIYLVDPFGRRRTLQYSSHRHYEVFCSFIKCEYGDRRSRPHGLMLYAPNQPHVAIADFLSGIFWDKMCQPGCELHFYEPGRCSGISFFGPSRSPLVGGLIYFPYYRDPLILTRKIRYFLKH